MMDNKPQITYPIILRSQKSFPISLIVFGTLIGTIMPYLLLQKAVNNSSLAVSLFLTLGGLILIVAAYSSFRWRVEIYHDFVREIRVFRKNELLLENISGFTLEEDGNTINIIPKDEKVQTITITLLTVDRQKEFMEWAGSTLHNLTIEAMKAQMDHFYHNEKWGKNEETRAIMMDRAYSTTRIINIVSLVAPLLMLFLKNPLFLIILLLFLMTSASLVVWYFKGLVKFGGNFGNIYPNIITPYAISLLLVLVVTRASYEMILDWQPILKPWGVFSLATILFMFFCMKELGSKKKYFLVPLFAVIFAFGVILATNRTLDLSASTCCTTTIEKIPKCKQNKPCTMTVIPCDKDMRLDKVEVKSKSCKSKEVGDKIAVCIKSGYWGIPWYFAE